MKRIKISKIIFALFLLGFVLFMGQKRPDYNNEIFAASDDRATENSYDKNELIALVTQRIANESIDRRQVNQEIEYQNMLVVHQQKKEALDLIVRELGMTKDIGIVFGHNSRAGLRFANVEHEGRYLFLNDRKVSFLYSDFFTFLEVRLNQRLTEALEYISDDVLFAVFRDGVATFTLMDFYFKEDVTLVYTYYENKDAKNYLTNGVRTGDGWTINMYGYSSMVDEFFVSTFAPGLILYESEEPPGMLFPWPLDEAEEYLKNKTIIINLVFLGFLCLILSIYLYQKEKLS